jgi:sporulation protein YlmC with PRC-barrel domain
MKRANIFVVASLALMMPGIAGAQVAGSTLIGVAAAELRDVTMGWSAKKQILSQPVYNEKSEKIGSVDDIIVSPAKAVSYAIVGVGGFLGVAKHDVAIPVNQFSQMDGKLVLAGGSKDAVQAMPVFDYAQR